MNKPKLIDHRKKLAAEGNAAYTYEIDYNISRLCRTLANHLAKAGYCRFSSPNSQEALERIIRLLFAAQEERPMFHVEGTQLPLCWNNPPDWDKSYIKYEWGHLLSRNQNGASSDNAENLALYSARCNQHIQTSMDIQELMIYGGILADRISHVLTARRKLFVSAEWKECLAMLKTA